VQTQPLLLHAQGGWPGLRPGLAVHHCLVYCLHPGQWHCLRLQRCEA
jgi:hypothetical protein